MNHALHIDRLTSEWKLPRDQSLDALSVDALNDLATRQLPRVLAASLENICSEEDESIWLIRRLNVSLGVDLSWSSDEVAIRWAHGVTVSLLKTIQTEPDNQLVFHFRSRAEYLAAFLTDVASGTAWNKWQYASFSGMAAMSSSAVIRTLLVIEPGPALAALSTLTPSNLRRVLAALLSHDAAQCWMRLMHSSVPLLEEFLSRTLNVWESDRELWPSSDSAERDFLSLLARVLNRQTRYKNAWQELASAAAAVIALERLLAKTPPEQLPDVKSQLLSGRIAEVPLDIGVPAHVLRPWESCAELLQRAMDVAGKENGNGNKDVRATALGCVFLLLPLIEQLPLEKWTNQPALLKFAVIVQCCSVEMRAAARADSLLRDLFGVSPTLDLDQLELSAAANDVWEWMRQADLTAATMDFDPTYLGKAEVVSVAAHCVLRSFAWKLSGFGTCSLRYLWSNFLDFSAHIEIRTDRIVVRMATPPLHVILRLSGLTSGSHIFPNIDPRPFHFFQET